MRKWLLVASLAPLIAVAAPTQSSPKRRAIVRLAPNAALPAIDGVVFGGRVGDVVSADVAPEAEAALAAAVRGVEGDPRVFPHNDTSQASTIGFRGDVSIAAEVDSYAFEAAAGQEVRIRVHSEGTLDPFLDVDNGGSVT